jgi:hypothetical protein
MFRLRLVFSLRLAITKVLMISSSETLTISMDSGRSIGCERLVRFQFPSVVLDLNLIHEA